MTRERAFAKGQGRTFASPAEVLAAYDAGEVELHAKVNVRMPSPVLKTRLLNDLSEHADIRLLVGVDGGRDASEAWFSHRGALRTVENGVVGEVPVLGGDVHVNLNGGDGNGGDAVAIFDLHTDNGEGSGSEGAWTFVASGLSGKGKVPAVYSDKGTASRKVKKIEGEDFTAVGVELPKLRGNGRVVGLVNPSLASDKSGLVIDARMNVNSRLDLLNRAIKAMRAEFGEDLVMVATSAGFFGHQGKVPLNSRGSVVETTVGRVLFYDIVPEEVPFSLCNQTLKKKNLGELIDRCYRAAGAKKTVLFADALMQLGFGMSTKAGISICVDDMCIPSTKGQILEEAQAEVEETESQYNDGLITMGEKYNKVVDIWSKVTDEVSKNLISEISTEVVTDAEGNEAEQDAFNSIFMMVDSGARGSTTQIRQLAGMRGLMAKPSGEIIETPITANFREGLTVLQYFISTHGARKGLADTALKTANSGYLTRRLVDVVQDFIVTARDCGTQDSMEISSLIEGGEIIEHVAERVLGQVAAEDIYDPYSDEILVARNEMIDEAACERLVQAGVDRVQIRSVMSCDMHWGVCSMCYGRDLARGKLVNIGEAVGVIAAQSIGEPELSSMRTFHIGGAASAKLTESYLELKNSGTIKYSELLNTVVDRDGNTIALARNGEIYVVDEKGRERERYGIPYGSTLLVKDGDRVAATTGSRSGTPSPRRSWRMTTVSLPTKTSSMAVRWLSRPTSSLGGSGWWSWTTRSPISSLSSPSKVSVLLGCSCLQAPTSSRTRATRFSLATSSRRFHARPRRPRTSLVVFLGSLSCSKPVSPRRWPSSPRSRVSSASVRTPRVSDVSSSLPRVKRHTSTSFRRVRTLLSTRVTMSALATH